MKRTSVILFLLCLSVELLSAHTYVSSSVLSEGNLVKIQVSSSGVYRITYEQLQEWGLNPKNIRVLGYGGNLIPQDFTLAHTDDVPSVPFYMHTGADGVFSPGDYILFYAEGPVGWEWNGKYFVHTRNCYADYGCYFLNDNAGEQRLLAEGKADEEDALYDNYTYTALQLHEQDERNLVDVLYGVEGGGREWYGEILNTIKPNCSVAFKFQDVDTTMTAVCRVDAAANCNEVTNMNVQVGGVKRSFSFMPLEDFYTKATEGAINITNAKVSNSFSVQLNYQFTQENAIAYLNYIEMQVPCLLNMRGKNVLYIRNTDNLKQPGSSCYHLSGADASTQIWDMTDPEQAFIVPTTWHNDTLCWLGANRQSQLFIAVRTNTSTGSTPAYIGKVPNQNLHKRLRGAQHVIITPAAFRSAANRLKAIHEYYTPDERWEVVSDEEVFNEFSSGTPDASAFRWMMKYLYDEFAGTDNAPKDLLLFGDGSFDNRQLLTTSPYPTLLTYQAHNSLVETNAYATDDYFGFLEDNDGIIGSNWEDKRGTMEISVGRLPVNTLEEAEQVVNKIQNYLSNVTAGSWKQQTCFLADDGNQGLHVTTADVAAEALRQTAPDFTVNKIYLDAYVQETSASGESYPLAYNQFTNMLQSGVMLMDYAGHGSANNICSEMFLTRKQVENMSNAHLGLWMLATCSFAHFDRKEPSSAESAVLNPIGGAIAVVAADRTVYASENEKINRQFCQRLFEHDDPFNYPYTIGEALRLAKNAIPNNMNKLTYVLLGDPALRLNYPVKYQAVISQMPDTLHALDLVTVSGYISNGDLSDATGRADTVDFNGLLSVTIFDKIQKVLTHDNDEPAEEKKVIKTFMDYPNKIFVGEADVVNGRFTFTFRMPKDIRYNIAEGRMALYAVGTDSEGQAEAIGHNTDFAVGGSSPWILIDDKGPDIDMYLNTPLFQNGDCVNSTPHFYASLYDENGINTIGSGIGHDLLLVLDNSTKLSHNLNDYYKAENNSYQRGTVSYMLPELSDGSHSLTFRAWDLNNNASTKSLSFSVDSEQGPEAKQVIVYPNPVSQFGTLNLYLVNDRPDDYLTINLTIYNMVGAKVWSAARPLDGQTISFSMAQTAIPAGTYIYQFTIQTPSQESQRYGGRIIVY
ncbi:MAG: type IX secretion system sortase PorU [Paludibacteraceae bacterium]|nr:type IX secretion system sortase PorU [Paludibacteraceae bacterium]